MKCDLCLAKECYQGKDCLELQGAVMDSYTDDDRKAHRVAAAIEASYYMQKTRVEELILFSREMGFERLGVAFCIGLKYEAKVLCGYLRRHFEVYSACCKVCGVSKEELGLQKINEDKFEAMCNPLMQARALQEKETDLNVTVGLCIGHDLIFNKYSHAPSTTLVVKDRVLSHNPAGALYSRYYHNKIGLSKD